MYITKWVGTVILASTITVGGCRNKNDNASQNVDTGKDRPPNFITLVLDDMGIADLGIFGGEIPTPNIDQLAEEGIILDNFYAAPTSTPSRGMLFTGKDHHQAGVGSMKAWIHGDQIGDPNYHARLSLDALPFPELLQQNGYHTMMTGKWDLGETSEYYPINRGFTETRATLLLGTETHYSEKDGSVIKESIAEHYKGLKRKSEVVSPYNEMGEELEKFPREFYSTDYYTDMGIQMLNNRDKDKPFYLNISYTAPHNPLQAPAGLF